MGALLSKKRKLTVCMLQGRQSNVILHDKLLKFDLADVKVKFVDSPKCDFYILINNGAIAENLELKHLADSKNKFAYELGDIPYDDQSMTNYVYLFTKLFLMRKSD